MKLFDYRTAGSVHPEGLIEYLKNTLDFKIELDYDRGDYGMEIHSKEDLNPEQYQQVINKVELTSLRFVDKNNTIHEYPYKK